MVRSKLSTRTPSLLAGRGERGGDDVRIRKPELRLRSGGVEQGEGRDGQRCIADDAGGTATATVGHKDTRARQPRRDYGALAMPTHRRYGADVPSRP
jgi:hypothetical protein